MHEAADDRHAGGGDPVYICRAAVRRGHGSISSPGSDKGAFYGTIFKNATTS
jgi:hypothetical protein